MDARGEDALFTQYTLDDADECRDEVIVIVGALGVLAAGLTVRLEAL